MIEVLLVLIGVAVLGIVVAWLLEDDEEEEEGTS